MRNWIIVAGSNYDDEMFFETALAHRGKDGSSVVLKYTEEKADEICHALNEALDPCGEIWYKVRPDTYKLYEFQP